MRKELLLLILLGTGVAAPAAPAVKARPAMAVPVVVTGRVGESGAREVRKYVGMITAIEDVELIARTSGTLTKQVVPSGAKVKKGQLLFTLEDTIYRDAVESARAKVKQAEAEVEYARLNLVRRTTLKGQQAVAESAFEEAVRLFAINEAQLAQAKAALHDAETDLGYTQVVSPVDGRMGKAILSEGNYVRANTTILARVVSYDPIRVEFAVSERDYLTNFGSIDTLKKYGRVTIRLADGRLYSRSVNGHDEPVRGRIDFLDNKVDGSTDTVIVRAEFPNAEAQLLPGGLCTVLLQRETDRKLATVPLTAVMTDRQGNYVYVLDAQNKVARRNVQLGSADGDRQLVESGLTPGETIIVDGTHKAMPGYPVQPAPAAEQAARK